jgi:hypothetical protein
MLQIISGKFYRSENRNHNDCKGILYSNISWPQKIETCVATIEASECYGQIASYVISYDNQIEKPEVSTGFELVKTGDKEIIRQLKIICAFALNSFFDEEKTAVYNLCRQYAITSRDHKIPSGCIPRTLDLGLQATQQEVDYLIEFINNMIGLPRIIYNALINCIDTYNKALIALDSDIYLAYSMMVYCLESLSQRFDNYVPSWEDYDQNQRVRLERCFDGLDSSKVQIIKDILTENAHFKLSKRFISFVTENLDEAFFTTYAHKRKRALQKSELDQALLNAYKIRSKYVHALEPIMPQLTIPSISKDSDVYEFIHDTFLTLSGLQRIVRKAVKNFVEKQIKVSTEELNWQNELPDILHMEQAPQYWIWKHEGLQPEHIVGKFEGLIEIIVSGAKGLPDMRNVIDKCMTFFDKAKPQHKMVIYCLNKLYNSFIAEESRTSNYEKFLSDNSALLNDCCIESLALVSLPLSFDHKINWDSETLESVIIKYNKRKFDSKHIRFPVIFETIIYLQMANSYKDDNNMEKQKEWLHYALLNCAGNEMLQRQIYKTLETLDVFDISSLYYTILKTEKP